MTPLQGPDIGAATQTLNELLGRQCYYLITTIRVEINSLKVFCYSQFSFSERILPKDDRHWNHRPFFFDSEIRNDISKEASSSAVSQ